MSDGQTVEYVDTDLVRRAKQGDLAAFEELFNQHQKRVYNIVYGMVCNDNDAAELTQDVFVRVFRSIKSLRAEEAFFTWLRTTAVNMCRDHMRRRNGVRIESLDEKILLNGGDELEREVPDKAANPAKVLEAKDTRRAVHTAIDMLSDEHRAVVTLHHLEGLDVQEIAQMLCCPVGTVKSRLARARDELRRRLTPYVED